VNHSHQNKLAGFMSVSMLLCLAFFSPVSYAAPARADHPDFVLAQSFFQRAQYQKAQEYFQKVLVEEPDHIEAHYALSRIYFLRENWLKAFFQLRETLSLDKSYKDARGLFAQTLENLRESLVVLKTDPESLSAQIYLDFQAGKMDQAKLNIGLLTSTHPTYAFGWDHLANYHYRQQNLDAAMQNLKTALSLAPASPTIFRHYETTYYLKNHKILPKRERPKAFQQKSEDVKEQVLDEWLEKEILENEGQDVVLTSSSGQEIVPGAAPKVSHGSLFAKLLAKEKENVPIEPESETKTKVETKTEPKYEPIPVRQENRNQEEEALIERASEAFKEKNWEVAATSYGILSQNNPKNKVYAQRLEQLKRYDEFEREYKLALLYVARGKKNPENFKKAEELFSSLNTRTYFELYKKNSFDNYLAAIAFSRRNWKEAQKYYQRWLQFEKTDEQAHYYYMRTLITLGDWDAAFKAYKNGLKHAGKSFASMPGMTKIKMQVYLQHYLSLIFLVIFLWIACMAAYLYFKISRKAKISQRKNLFQTVRDLSSEKRFNEMIQKIDELLLTEITPNEHYNLNYLKANGLYQTRQLEKAELQAKAILARHSSDSQTQLLLGRIFAAQEKTEQECLEAYRILSIKEPSNLDVLKIYLQTLKLQEIYTEETEKVALKILDLESYNNDILKDLVDIYTQRQLYNDRSADILRRYNELHPGQPLLMLHYLEALSSTQNYIEAIKTGKKILDINPDLERAHQLLIEAFDQLNMREELKNYYHQLSLDFGSSEVVQKMYTMVETNYKVSTVLNDENKRKDSDITRIAYEEGIALMEQKAYKQAILKFQTALNDQRLEFDARVMITRSYVFLGDMESAKFYFSQIDFRAQRLDENALDLLYEFANYHKETKDISRALQYFRLIARNDVGYKETFQNIELLSAEEKSQNLE